MTSFISASEAERGAKRSLAAGIFLALSAFIYSRFSHGVSSPAMTFAFLVPLVLEGLPAVLVWKRGGADLDSETGARLYRAGTWTLTAALVLKGILVIAGTSSRYQRLLFILAVLELAAGILLILTARVSGRGLKGRDKEHR